MKFLDVPQSGSYAGVTHSRNRFGQYRRTRAIPVNPNSSQQAVQRTNLADFSSAWRGIDPGQRTGWNALADEVSFVNSLGATINLTGHQLFVKLNLANATGGFSLMEDAPLQVSFDALGTLNVLADVTGPTFTVEAPDAVNTGQVFQIWASPQRSPGRYFEADYRLIAVQSFAEITGPTDISTAYVTRLGSLTVGRKIFIKVVQMETGWQDSGNVTSTIVTA